MTRSTIFRTGLLTVVVTLAGLAAGAGAWLLIRTPGHQPPQISAYTHGQLTLVGPYLYCNALNLNVCETPHAQGALTVNTRDPIQLSVPSAIGRAPWRLLRVYGDPTNTTAAFFRPGSRLAVTIPTVDPQRGRLTGIAVQLLTLVADPAGELHEAPHAEWSVRIGWGS